jgi:flagellar basal-body rod protein FlgF
VIDRFIYTAMTGAKHATGQLATTTHNLANAQTLGFKEMLSAFRTVPIAGASADSRAFVVDSTPGFNSTPGTLQYTGNRLDIALVQQGYFAYQVDGNSEAYSRDGRLMVNSDGYLSNLKGQLALSADNGPIFVGSDNQSVYLGNDGSVFVKGPDGEQTTLTKLKVVNPPASEMSRRPDGFFSTSQPWQAPVDGVAMKAGTVESSNVNVAQSMVEMIKQNRMFDLNFRMIQMADQNARSAQNLFSLSRA